MATETLTLLEKVKLALRLKTSAFDSEIESLIESAKLDMGIAGIFNVDESDPLIVTAIITYCKLNFGTPYEDSNLRKSYYGNLKSAYDEQKAQLGMATGYTKWGDTDVLSD